MKKLAILLLTAAVFSFASCEKEKTLAVDDPDTPVAPTDTIDPNTPTISFYAEMASLFGFPRNFGWLFIDSTAKHPIPKYGKIWLLDNETGKQIYNQSIGDEPTFFGSYWNLNAGSMMPPHDSNYFYNPYDIFTLFENGTFSAIQTIEYPYGEFQNVPLGDYCLLASMGAFHEETMKSYQGSITRVHIDSTFSTDTIRLFCSFVNAYGTWLTLSN